MALSRKTWARAKQARIQEEWPQVDDKVFEQLGLTRQTLTELEHALVGKIVLPGMPDYPQARVGDGLVPYQSYPLIIVYCALINDVALCLAWAQRYEWWVTCRAGGHSTAGYSVNSGIVIDVTGINYVSVDPFLKQARVGSGTRFRQLNSVLDSYRLHLPGGSCSDVGVAGFMQGGGYGFTSREFGIHSDNVLSVTVMLANGRLVVANPTQNQDLFWAIRGGTGGNFGVLIESTYQLHDLHEVWGFCLSWPLEQAAAVLYELQHGYMTKGAPPQLGYLAVLTTFDEVPSVGMIGMYHGTREAGWQALASLRAIGTPTVRLDRQGPYGTLNDELLDILPGIPPPPGQTLEAKDCGYIATSLTQAQWQMVADYFATSPNPYNIVFIEPYGATINRYPVEASAFIHRDVSMDFYVDTFWKKAGDFTHEKEARAWLEGFMALMQPHFNGHKYQNYPQRGFADYRWAYWGDAFNSLLFVKQKYDPTNVFHYEQSISPYPDEEPTLHRSTVPSMFSDPHIVYVDEQLSGQDAAGAASASPAAG